MYATFLEPKLKYLKTLHASSCFSVSVLSVLLKTSVGDSEVTLFGISKPYVIASMCLALTAATTKCITTIRVNKSHEREFLGSAQKSIGLGKDQFFIMGSSKVAPE